MRDRPDRGVPGFLSEEPETVEARRPRSPLVAFLVSLVVPGAGHFYAGKWKRGWTTLALFLLGLSVVAFSRPDQTNVRAVEVAFALALAMYVFGFLDSYFAVRELNDGSEEFLPTNPRIAAVLNFLTNGFGYFYVGQRAKGIALCIGLWIVNGVLRNVTVTTLAPLLVVIFGLLQLGMAIDAYRIARREGSEIRAVLPQPAAEPARGLPAAVPLTLAFAVVAGYLGLALLGGIYQSVGLTDEELGLTASEAPAATSLASRAARRATRAPEKVLDDVGDSKSWAVPGEGLTMKLPVAWEQYSGDTGYAMAASSPGNKCMVTVSVADADGLPPLSQHASTISAKFLSVHTNASIRGRGPKTLGNRPGEEVVYELVRPEGTLVESHVLTVAGRRLYAFRAVTLPGELCSSEADWIRRQIEIAESPAE